MKPVLLPRLNFSFALVVLGCALTDLPRAQAADFTWNSSGNGFYTTGGNWAGGASPSTSVSTTTNSITTPTMFGDVQMDAGTTRYLQTFNVNLSNDWSWVTGGTGNRSLNITGTLTKNGAADLKFSNGTANSGANNYSLGINQINVGEGSVSLGGFAGNSSSVYLTSVNVMGATSVSSGATLNVDSPSATLAGVTVDGIMNVYQVNKQNLVGGTTVAGIAGTGTIQTRNLSSTDGPGTVSGTLNLNGASGTATFAGFLTNTGGTGTNAATTFALNKAGAYTQILTGNTNTYTGGTTITAGTLLANNTSGSATGTGSVTVSNSGTVLGGNGRISGPVIVGNGAVLSAGAAATAGSVGTLSTGALTLNNTTAVRFDLNTPGVTGGGTNDLLAVTGALTLDGQLAINGLAAFGQGRYTLFTYTGALTDNTLEVSSAPTGYSYVINTSTANSVYLDVTAVPEPTTLLGAALMAGALGYNQRRWLRAVLERLSSPV